ncbi:hypothetical protein F5X98DRAFT_350489 [Xylaria grammica]|nr:hypothetical protein F5X98DRAFT_350489 [Xylaria grammica]
MSEYVEARSLAALNQLAANPPQYPTKPNETKQDPLTLYISRVPGTRDIILSTLKPQLKNVTASDVASSLYYAHFHQPEDELLPALNQPRHPASPRSSGESSRPRIHRKPLPNTPGQPVPGTAPIAPAAGLGNGNQGHESPTRRPTPGTAFGGMSEHQPSNPILAPAGYGVSLSPRSPSTDAVGHYAPPLPNVPRPPYHEPPYVEDQPPALPTRPRNGHYASDLTDATYSNHNSAASAHASLPTGRRPFTPFSLTLIRRDPTSGQQWNVGKIASFQLENPELLDDERRHQASPSIQIHLETSGYAKFRGMPAGPELGLRGSLDLRPGSSPPSIGIPASGPFERQVKMMYSPSFTAGLRQHFRSRSSIDERRPTSPIKRSGHHRGNSQTSMGSFGGDFDSSDAPIITQPAPGLKPRGYMFYSPWDGRCEFVTGKAGRTLKCRHVLPTYGGGLYNPLVDGPDPEHGDERPKPDNARPISELRFNLPSNELLADKKSTEGHMRTRDHLQSQFNRMVAKAQGLDDSDDGELPFDLSLGREKAGGGNRGKRAKMGKLIIFDEGLKMLDLAVAANLGIWWNTWERTY